jgi:hypothetical protein
LKEGKDFSDKKTHHAGNMKQLLLIAISFIAIFTASWVLHFQHRNRPSGCSLDGSQIQPLYEVTIIDEDKVPRSFSCVLTARIWVDENREQIASILVTDEATGRKIKAEDAFFVVSTVVTTRYTGNRIHVFAHKSRATSHAVQFNGRLIGNPFQTPEEEPVLIAKHRPGLPGGPDLLFPYSHKPLSLVAEIAIRTEQDCSYLPKASFSRLSDGYSAPHEKPPKTVIYTSHQIADIVMP